MDQKHHWLWYDEEIDGDLINYKEAAASMKMATDATKKLTVSAKLSDDSFTKLKELLYGSNWPPLAKPTLQKFAQHGYRKAWLVRASGKIAQKLAIAEDTTKVTFSPGVHCLVTHVELRGPGVEPLTIEVQCKSMAPGNTLEVDLAPHLPGYAPPTPKKSNHGIEPSWELPF